MIKIENTYVYGWEAAIRGMRNPLNSWDRSDSKYDVGYFGDDGCELEHYDVVIGDNDHDLMMRLAKGGATHAKYRRMITVTCDITCHHTWWAEFDTYKVGTVRNSCSKMHKIHAKEFVADDFSAEGIEECGGRTSEVFARVLEELERLRKLFNETQEKKYWRAIIELLPMGYNIKATVQFNYEVLAGMYRDRKSHKVDEWPAFCDWIEQLPYSEIITQGEKREKYFSPAQVRAMTASEIRENYEAIMDSMKKW